MKHSYFFRLQDSLKYNIRLIMTKLLLTGSHLLTASSWHSATLATGCTSVPLSGRFHESPVMCEARKVGQKFLGRLWKLSLFSTFIANNRQILLSNKSWAVWTMRKININIKSTSYLNSKINKYKNNKINKKINKINIKIKHN